MQGYRTYIIAIIVAVVGIAHTAGYINDSVYQLLLALFNGGALMTIRAAITNESKVK